MNNPFSQRLSEMSRPLTLLVLVLTGIGVLMMISAGGGDWDIYAKSHLLKVGVGLALMMIVALMPMRWLYQYAYIFYLLVLAMLVVVEIVGHIGMGAQRWISLGGVVIQPSELMKLAMVLVLARYFHTLQGDEIGRFRHLLFPAALLTIPVVLILKQPNLGTALITAGIGVIMLYMAGLPKRYFILGALTVGAAAPIMWQFLHDYQKQRVYTFLDPSQDPLGAGYNILQSMIAIGSGGFWGKGFIQGSQGQLNFLPEKHTDFIFTMFAEEWGFIGCMVLLGLYAMLLLIGTILAATSRSNFGSLVATGVTAMMFIHIFVNIGMVMGLLPVVGVPLPFLSYGGSMMLSTMIAMGLLLNIYIHRNKPLLLVTEIM